MLLQRPFLLLAAVTLLLAPFTVATDFDSISVKYSGQATVEVYINTTPIKNSMGNNTGDGLHDTIRASLRSVCPDTTANNCQRLSAARIPSKKALPDGSFADIHIYVEFILSFFKTNQVRDLLIGAIADVYEAATDLDGNC